MFPTPVEFFSGMLSDSASSKSGGFSDFLNWAIFALIFISFSEPFKLIFRRNIGAKALNIYWVFLSSATFSLYAIFMYVLAVLMRSRDFYGANFTGLAYKKYILYTATLVYAFLAFYILIRGTHEYYQARARNSKTLKELEYRGDSIFMADKAAWEQNRIWRVAEPNASLWIALMLCVINIALGLPLLAASISFRINEWYQIHYKHIRMRESYRNMKIEAEKANDYYSEIASHEPVSRVVIEN